MKIEVKEKHIKKGKPRNSCDCPIALAMKDAGLKDCFVECLFVDISNNLETYTMVNLPAKVSQFIHDFDEGLEVSPFEFELDYQLTN